MISPCVRCGRMIVSGSRCPSCQCGRCGGATDQSRWGVCPKCDAKDLALADSDDLAGIRRRLDTLLVELQWSPGFVAGETARNAKHCPAAG